MNVTILIGRLTKDPELRYTPETQNAVCTFTLAVDRPMSRDRQADFIRITVFGKQAENCAKFITKGKQVAVEGRIQTGSYRNQNGDTVYTTDVIANRVEFLGGARDDSHHPSANQPMQKNESYDPRAPKGDQQISMRTAPPGFEPIEDDDIPF